MSWGAGVDEQGWSLFDQHFVWLLCCANKVWRALQFCGISRDSRLSPRQLYLAVSSSKSNHGPLISLSNFFQWKWKVPIMRTSKHRSLLVFGHVHVSIGDLHIPTSCQFWGYISCKILDTDIKLATTLNDENWWCQVKMLRYLFIGQFFHRPSNHRGTTVSHTKKPNADQEQILFCLFLILGFLFYHHLDQRHLLPNNKHGSALRMPWWNALHYIYIVNYFPQSFCSLDHALLAHCRCCRSLSHFLCEPNLPPRWPSWHVLPHTWHAVTDWDSSLCHHVYLTSWSWQLRQFRRSLLVPESSIHEFNPQMC